MIKSRKILSALQQRAKLQVLKNTILKYGLGATQRLVQYGANPHIHMDFLVGGLAAVTAGIFTNPLEVIKTRLQLQGELRAKGKHAVHYRNVFHATYVIARNDGMLALQNGLVPALWVQFILNGLRLGFFEFGDIRGWTKNKNGETVFFKNVMVGGIGGVLGQYVVSPIYLYKTHLQSKAAEEIAVGHQYRYQGGMWTGLKTIYSSQGIKGLFRGAVGSVPRAFVGSTSQLTSFTYCKQWLNSYDTFRERPLLTSIVASMVGGVSISVMMNPFDLVCTRLYNQPADSQGVGILYKNYVDCVVKIYKSEGATAFYKGIGPMYLRLGPHTLLCLTFWDIYKDMYEKYLEPIM